MEIRWYGQSAFLLRGEQTVFIDPCGSMEVFAARGLRFAYPPIEDVDAELLLVTHEHADHNGVEAIAGTPQIVRSTAGTFKTPVGEVAAIASEHDDAAGTKRGPNTIFRFALDGLRVCHLGDLGQPALREEQLRAIGDVDVLFMPAGGGPTVGGEAAAAIARRLRPRLVVPMHYRTDAVDFLELPDPFVDALAARVERLETTTIDVGALLGTADAPTVAMPATP